MQGDSTWVEILLRKAWHHARNELEEFVRGFGRSLERWLGHHWPTLNLGQWRDDLDHFLSDWQRDGITLEPHSYDELVAWLQAWEEHLKQAPGQTPSAAVHRDDALTEKQLALTPEPGEAHAISRTTENDETTGQDEQAPDLLAQVPAEQTESEKQPRAFQNDFGQFNPRGEFNQDKGSHWHRKKEDDAIMVALRAHVRSNIRVEILVPLFNGGLKVAVGKTLKDLKQDGEAIGGGQSGGKYDPHEGTIYIARDLADGKPNKFIERNLRHEIGHAFDHMINGSVDPAFLAAYDADLKAIPRRDLENPGLKGIGHYLPRGEDKSYSAREAFAEAFAEVTKTVDPPGNQQAGFFKDAFVNTINYMKLRVADYANQHPLSEEERKQLKEQRKVEDLQRLQGR